MRQEVEILQPAFYEKFACIGPSCTDNCCHTWEINIDKEHYLLYKAQQDPSFRSLCSRVVHRRKKDGTPEQFASLALDEDGRCGFQDPDGGCRIIRALGPQALSHTCTLYPRRKAQFLPGIWELSLSLSCTEAARLALFSQEKTEFVSRTRSVDPHDPLDAMPPLGIGPGGKPVAPPVYGSPLRQVCLELIRCRDYQLPERILAVGLLLRRVDRLLKDGRDGEIPAMCAGFLTSVQKGEFQGFFQRLEYHPEAHQAAMRLPVAHLLGGARKPVLRHLWQALEPWCAADPATGEYQAGREALDFLIKTGKEKGDPILESLATAAENYFVSYLFSSMFPFLYRAEGLSFEHNGILLAEQYALLRLLLALAPQAPCPEDQLIQAVVSLARLSQHSDLGGDLLRLTRAVQLDGLAHAAYLLR